MSSYADIITLTFFKYIYNSTCSNPSRINNLEGDATQGRPMESPPKQHPVDVLSATTTPQASPLLAEGQSWTAKKNDNWQVRHQKIQICLTFSPRLCFVPIPWNKWEKDLEKKNGWFGISLWEGPGFYNNKSPHPKPEINITADHPEQLTDTSCKQCKPTVISCQNHLHWNNQKDPESLKCWTQVAFPFRKNP